MYTCEQVQKARIREEKLILIRGKGLLFEIINKIRQLIFRQIRKILKNKDFFFVRIPTWQRLSLKMYKF
jgi:hypothetical protein